jgi:hypothetical protein
MVSFLWFRVYYIYILYAIYHWEEYIYKIGLSSMMPSQDFFAQKSQFVLYVLYMLVGGCHFKVVFLAGHVGVFARLHNS